MYITEFVQYITEFEILSWHIAQRFLVCFSEYEQLQAKKDKLADENESLKKQMQQMKLGLG